MVFLHNLFINFLNFLIFWKLHFISHNWENNIIYTIIINVLFSYFNYIYFFFSYSYCFLNVFLILIILIILFFSFQLNILIIIQVLVVEIILNIFNIINRVIVNILLVLWQYEIAYQYLSTKFSQSFTHCFIPYIALVCMDIYEPSIS